MNIVVDRSSVSYVSLLVIALGSIMISSGIVTSDAFIIAGGFLVLSLGFILWIEVLVSEVKNEILFALDEDISPKE